MNKLEKVIVFTLLTILILFILFNFGMAIYVCVIYGNKPVNEIPAWALMWL